MCDGRVGRQGETRYWRCGCPGKSVALVPHAVSMHQVLIPSSQALSGHGMEHGVMSHEHGLDVYCESSCAMLLLAADVCCRRHWLSNLLLVSSRLSFAGFAGMQVPCPRPGRKFAECSGAGTCTRVSGLQAQGKVALAEGR